jgi:hypothetical protein
MVIRVCDECYWRDIDRSHPTESCVRCGLRRSTRILEAQGRYIRLCDECYWGQETVTGTTPEVAAKDTSPASRR